MKRFILVFITACWANPPAPTLRIVYRPKYVHDVPRECAGLPSFPPIIIISEKAYVEQIDKWIDRASQCLYVKTYRVSGLLEVVKW